MDWGKPAVEVDRLIRGLSPFPGAWCEIDGARVKLLASRVVSGQAVPGTVLEGFAVACGDGAVEVTRAQRAGKQAQDVAAFLAGFEMPKRLGEG